MERNWSWGFIASCRGFYASVISELLNILDKIQCKMKNLHKRWYFEKNIVSVFLSIQDSRVQFSLEPIDNRHQFFKICLHQKKESHAGLDQYDSVSSFIFGWTIPLSYNRLKEWIREKAVKVKVNGEQVGRATWQHIHADLTPLTPPRQTHTRIRDGREGSVDWTGEDFGTRCLVKLSSHSHVQEHCKIHPQTFHQK